jgi:hypothetical protein
MASIVHELQRTATDPGVTVADLLRRALVAAKKLNLRDFEEWIGHEMDGYPAGSGIPDYHRVSGFVKALNPVRGWIPVQFADLTDETRFSTMPMIQPVAELEAVIAGADRNGSVMLSYGGDVERRLLESEPMMAGVALQVPVPRVTAILDAVRNAVLRWALQLEADGIAGDDVSFSQHERQVADSRNYSVNNFYGPVGSAQIQQASPGALQAGNDLNVDSPRLDQALGVLRKIQAELGNTEEASELAAELDTIAAQRKSPRPKWRLIKETLQSARRIAESAAGRLVGTALSRELAQVDWSAIWRHQ